MSICGLTMHLSPEKSCLGNLCQMWDDARQDCGLKAMPPLKRTVSYEPHPKEHYPIKYQVQEEIKRINSPIPRECQVALGDDRPDKEKLSPPFMMRYDIIDHEIVSNLRLYWADEGSLYNSANPLLVKDEGMPALRDLIVTLNNMILYYQGEPYPVLTPQPADYYIKGQERPIDVVSLYDNILIRFADGAATFVIHIPDDENRNMLLDKMKALIEAKKVAISEAMRPFSPLQRPKED